MPKATGAVEYLLKAYEDHLSSASLKPSDGGRFEVTIDGKPVYSKLDTGEFPEQDDLTKRVGEAINT